MININIGTTDTKYDINLPFGTLYKSDTRFYILGSKPVGNNYTSTTEERTEKVCVRPSGWDGEDENAWIIVNNPYSITTYKSILTADEVINKFIELIKETAVIIKDSEFFLKYPIITTGIAKVFLDNCVAHIEGEGFIKINNTQSGTILDGYPEFIQKLKEVVSVVSNNEISLIKYHKYGSQNKQDFLKRHFPSNTDYHLAVKKEDKVISAMTDKRGYPQSCGTDNKNKKLTIIIHGEE